MTPEEWAAAAAAAKAEYEHETSELRKQLERAKAKIVRLETQLASKTNLYRSKMARLGDTLLGLPVEEPPAPVVHHHAARKAQGLRKAQGRLTLDEPVLDLARELASPEVTARQILDVWNERNPDRPISDSTVRSILERLEAKGLIRTSQEGGGKGSGIPRKYCLPT